MQTITKHYIDGAFLESHSSEVMAIIKPSNGPTDLQRARRLASPRRYGQGAS